MSQRVSMWLHARLSSSSHTRKCGHSVPGTSLGINKEEERKSTRRPSPKPQGIAKGLPPQPEPDPAAGRMAEEALNLSLDDIIKKNAENNKRKSSSAGAAKRGGRGGRGGRGSSFQPKALGVQSRVVKTIRGGRGQSRGGRDRVAPRPERSYLKDPPRDNAALYGDASWKNDQYPQVVAAPRRNIQQRVGEPADGTKLNISNLDRNVTDVDIKELFQECGELKKCGVRFEPAGGSTGTAFVWFQHPEAAQDAFQKYNNIALDGKPMRIQFDHSEKILTSGVRVGSQSASGRVSVMQGSRLFQNAAEKAQIGGRAARQPGMRSSMRMDMD